MNWRRGAASLCAGVVAPLFWVAVAVSQEWWDASRNGIPEPSIATSLPNNGDPSGARKWLGERGIVFGFEYTNDLLVQPSMAGFAPARSIKASCKAIAIVDFGKLAGCDGLSLFANAFQIHNTGRIRRDHVGGINTIAAIEARADNAALGNLAGAEHSASGMASVRCGQIAADNEFFYSELSTMFLQSDWPTIAAVNLPSGGAAYPLSTPGVRLKVDPVKDAHVADRGAERRSGRTWGRRRAARNPQRPQLPGRRSAVPHRRGAAPRNAGRHDTGLATTLKLGGWDHIGTVQRHALRERRTVPRRSGWLRRAAPHTATSVSMPSSISRSTGRRAATLRAGFQCSAACRFLQPTATW